MGGALVATPLYASVNEIIFKNKNVKTNIIINNHLCFKY